MERTLRAARRARRRLAARDVIARAGRWMVAGAAAGGAMVIGEKIVGLPGAWWVWVGAPVLLAGIAAAVVELVRPRALLESAAVVDERLGLKDRLGSALALGTREGKNDPFVKLAMAESEAVAPTVDAARAVPIRFGSSWWTWPMIAAASVAAALWLPESSILKAKEQRRIAAAEQVKEQTRAAEEIREAVKVAEKTVVPDATATAADALAARRLEALAKLEEELRAGKIDADKAREESARTLEQAAAELEKRSEESQRTADATRDRLADLAPPSGQAGSESKEESSLTRAVRQGDLRAAREAARELMQKVDELSPEERAKIARDFEELSQELSRQKAAADAKKGAPSEAPAGESPAGKDEAAGGGKDSLLKEELKNQGLSEQQAKDAVGAGSEEEAKKKLEELGLPPEAAEKLAKKIVEDSQRRSAEKAAKQKTDELSKSLKDAADRLKEEPRAEQSPGEKREASPGEQRDAGEPGEKSARPAQKDAKKEGAGEKSGREGQPGAGEKSEKPGEQTGAKPGDAQRDQRGEKGSDATKSDNTKGERAGEKRGDQPGDKTGAEQKGAEGAKKDGTAQQGEGAKGAEGAGEKKEGGAREGTKEQGAPEKGAEGAKRDGAQPGVKEKTGEKKAGEPGTKSGDKTGENKEGAKEQGAAGAEKNGAEQRGAEGLKKDGAAQKDQGEKRGEGTEAKKDQTGAKPGEKPSEQQGEPKDGSKGEGAKQEGPGEKGMRPGEKTPGAQEKPGAGEKQDGEKSPGAMKDPAAKEGQPGEKGDAGKEEGKEPGKLPNLDDLPSPDSVQGKALKKVIENLRNMEKEQQNAAKDRLASKEMREQARKMMENATPEQRKKLEQWAKEFAKENQREGKGGEGNERPDGENREDRGIAGDGERQGGTGAGDRPGNAVTDNRKLDTPRESSGFKTDLVDARPKEAGEKPVDGRVAGELPGDGKPGAPPSPMLSKQEAAAAIQRAKEGAQRAIDDRTIPGRYDKLLRKYFKRLPEKVTKEGTPPE